MVQVKNTMYSTGIKLIKSVRIQNQFESHQEARNLANCFGSDNGDFQKK